MFVPMVDILSYPWANYNNVLNFNLDRAITTNDTVSYQRCELNSSSTNEILNQETMNREKQEGKVILV